MKYNSDSVQSQDQQKSSLNLLKLSPANSSNQQASVKIPRPKTKWKSRLLLPGMILLTLGGLIVWSMQDAVLPVTNVEVVPVITQYRATNLQAFSADQTGKISAKSKAAKSAQQTAASKNIAAKTNSLQSPHARANFAVTLQNLKSGKVMTKGSGWLEASPFSTNATALTDGIIKEIFVLEGQLVKKGQPIATMINDDAKLALEQAKSNLQTARAKLSIAEKTHLAAKSNWKNPFEFQRNVDVAKANLDEAKAQLAKLKSDIKAATAKMHLLKDDFARSKQAHNENAISDSEMMQAKYNLDQQSALVDATKASAKIISAQIAKFDADLIAARKDLQLRIDHKRELDVSDAQVKQAKADHKNAIIKLATAQLRFDRMTVRSPITGVVMSMNKRPGAKLMIGSDNPDSAVVAELYNPKKMQARIDVQLSNVARVFIGQYVRITANIDTSDDKKVFLGKVVRMVHKADILKNTLEVKVELQNPNQLIKPDMIVRAEFFAPFNQAVKSAGATQKTSASKTENPTTSASNFSSDVMLLIPQELIQTEAKTSWVLIADPTSRTARKVVIKVGQFQKDSWVEIEDGLHLGDQLIATNPAKIKPGSRIKIVGESKKFK